MKTYARIVAIAAFGLSAAFPMIASADEPDTNIGQASEYPSNGLREAADERGLTLVQRLQGYPEGVVFGDLLEPTGKA